LTICFGYVWESTLTQMGWFFTKAALLTLVGSWVKAPRCADATGEITVPNPYAGKYRHPIRMYRPQGGDGYCAGIY
jgi:hypothetical protein